MASPLPNVLIAAHSFVKRFHSDLQCKFDLHTALDFNLTRTATVSFHGVGGLTVPRLARELRLLFSYEPPPRVIILEIGTNDLSSHSPEVVIGDLLDLVEFLQSVDSSMAVGVCKVLPRRHRSTGLPHEEFNTKAATLNKMMDALFDDRPSVFCVGPFGNPAPFSWSLVARRCAFELQRAVLPLPELQGCYFKRGLLASQCA